MCKIHLSIMKTNDIIKRPKNVRYINDKIGDSIILKNKFFIDVTNRDFPFIIIDKQVLYDINVKFHYQLINQYLELDNSWRSRNDIEKLNQKIIFGHVHRKMLFVENKKMNKYTFLLLQKMNFTFKKVYLINDEFTIKRYA